jgi:ribosomal protein L16 Arg81 hydroxylase
MPALDLSQLIAPLTEAEFFAKHWERAPLLVRGAAARFAGVFDLAELDNMLAEFGRPHAQGIRLAKYGEGGTNSSIPSDVPPHLDSLYAAYLQGCTLNVNDISEHHGRVRALIERLIDSFRCRVTSNLFLTPPGARAFPLHYDTHEVLVLQLDGAKHWRVYSPVIEAPLKQTTGDREVDHAIAGEPLLDVVVEAGDILYVPRGFLHEAWTESDRHSLHITAGIHATSIRDLLVELIDERVQHDVTLRRCPTPTELFGDPAALATVLRVRLEELANDDAGSLADRVAVRALLAEPSLPGPRFALDPRRELHLDTKLRKRDGARCHIVKGPADCTLYFQGNAVRGPAKLTPAFHFVAQQTAFTPHDLPGDLTDKERLTLSRRLLREGLLL